MLRIENLTKIFGDDVDAAREMLARGVGKDEIRAATGCTVGVDDVSLELEPGEFFVIMGLSGSGKSTLLRCLNRLIEPTSGRVLLRDPGGDVDVTALDEAALREVRRRRISMVFQRFSLFPHRTVLDNAAYGPEVQGVPKAEREALAAEMLGLVGLDGWSDAYPDELSGGMQQRVGLARALAVRGEVLLMDEPFSALDPLIKMQMQEEMVSLREKLGRTIVFITHDLDEALRLGDRVAIMESGRVVQVGTPEEIITSPRTDYVREFVEHADPSGVITAATVALPLDHERLERLEITGAARGLAHRGRPDVRFGFDAAGRPAVVEADGERATLAPLAEALAAPVPTVRRRDLVLLCPADATLRDVLHGRSRSSLPALVVDGDGRALGVISERELIDGMLHKRGPRTAGDAPATPRAAAAPDPTAAAPAAVR